MSSNPQASGATGSAPGGPGAQALGPEPDASGGVAEAMYRALAARSEDVMYLLDPHGVVRYIGPQLARYGLAPGPLIGRHFTDAIPLEDKARMTERLAAARRAGMRSAQEVRLLDDRGNVHWFEDHGTCQYDARGQVVAFTGFLRGTTAELRQGPRGRCQPGPCCRLAARPTGAPKGESQPAAAPPPDRPGEAPAPPPRELRARVHELMLELGSATLHTVGLEAAVRELCADLEARFGLPILVESTGDGGSLSPERRCCLYQVLRELLVSIGRRGQAGQAVVHIDRSGTWLNVKVIDNGKGIRGEPKPAVAAGEDGLGLAHWRAWLLPLGGTLSFQSDPGSGTRVLIRVPLTAQLEAAASTGAPGPAFPVSSRPGGAAAALAEPDRQPCTMHPQYPSWTLADAWSSYRESAQA